jgi:hypothetical protein
MSASATATVASPNPKTESAASLRMGVCKHVIARSCWGNAGRGGEFPSRLPDATECLMRRNGGGSRGAARALPFGGLRSAVAAAFAARATALGTFRVWPTAQRARWYWPRPSGSLPVGPWGGASLTPRHGGQPMIAASGCPRPGAAFHRRASKLRRPLPPLLRRYRAPISAPFFFGASSVW